jgi:hypothetical protein
MVLQDCFRSGWIHIVNLEKREVMTEIF